MDTKRERSSRRRGPILTRLGLALAVLLGAALIFMGCRALTAFTGSGFSDGSGFDAVYSLSVATAEAWERHLLPAIESLPEEDRAALAQTAAGLVESAWAGKAEDGARQARALLDGDTGAEAALRLLYATYLTNEGDAKIAKTKRDAITALPEAEAEAFRQSVLRCVLDESAAMPEAAAAAVGSAGGMPRQALLLQAFFIASGSQSAGTADAVATLKKGVRDPAMQLGAFRMIARREISWLWQLTVHNARAVILLGIALIADAVLLAFLMLREGTWAFSFKWLLILLIVDFLLYFLLMPMIYMVIQAFSENGGFTLSRMERLFQSPDNLSALRNTLIASAATMALGTAIAFPLAWLVGRTNLMGRRFFRSLFVLSYMVPPYVGAMAWTYLMNPNAGPVNQVLRALLGLADAPGPLNIYSLPGLIWVLTAFYYPYAFITISRAMEKMDPSLEEASRISGASPVLTVLRVTLPLMTPSLIAGALLVFVSAASCYGIPSIIAGGTSGLDTVTTRIKTVAERSQGGMADATGLSVFLMAAALLILFVSDVVLARKQYTTVSGKSVQPVIVDLRAWRAPLTVLTWLFALLMIFLPFGAILSISLRSDLGRPLFDPANFTFANWRMAFTDSQITVCLRNSLIFAAAAASAGILISCVMSYLLQRTRVRGRSIPNFLITLGSGTPSVVIALGLMMTMNGQLGLSLLQTPMIMVAAYLVKYLMMGMRTVVSSMSQIHVSLEESSQVSGAGWLRTMLRVTGPLILPSIAAGWFLIFIPCFYELSMSVLLSSPETTTVGEKLFEYWTFTSKPVSCAMAFGILLMVAALNLILSRLTKGRFSI